MTVLYVLVCLVLLMAILLQQGRGGDIASAFGGSGSSLGGSTQCSRRPTF